MNGLVSEDNFSDNELPSMENVENDGGMCSWNENPDTITVLVNENKMLKENLSESNASMKMACKQFAIATDTFSREQQEYEKKFQQAKEVVTTLREEIQQKDQLIETLKQQAMSEGKFELTDCEETGSKSFEAQLLNVKKSLESATEERDELRKKCVSLEARFDSLRTTSEEKQKKDCETIELLNQSIEHFKRIQAKEKKEKQELSASLKHVRLSFDELILEYENLIDAEKLHKATLLTQENEIQQLQQKVQLLESENLKQLNKAENYRAQFETEHEARQFLNNQYIALRTQFNRLLISKDKQNSGPSSLNARSKGNSCICPKCGHESPNIESLQLHCHSCGD